MKWIIGKLVGVAVLVLAWALALGSSYSTAPTAPAASSERLPAAVSAAPPATRPSPKAARVPRPALATPIVAERALDAIATDPWVEDADPATTGDGGDVDLMARALSASRRISAAADAARHRSASESASASDVEEGASSATPE